MIWVAVVAGAAVLFFLPLIIGAACGTEPLWLVALLLPALWFGAWIALVFLPRRKTPGRRAAPVRHAPQLPYWDDPRYLYGAVPPAGPAPGRRGHDRTRAGSQA